MSKVVLGAVALGLNGAVIAGGGWLIHTGLQKQNSQQAELASTLQEFNDGFSDNHCLQTLFPGLKKTDVQGSTESDLDANFFGTDASKPTTGCLVVNWDKESYANSKWKGNIRFLWAVRGGDKGFMAYLLGTPSNSSGTQSINWTGVAHTLAFEDSTENKKTWTLKKKHELAASGDQAKSFRKVESDTDNNKKFPGPGAALKMGTGTDFWGFFSSANDLANICDANGCSDPSTKTKFRGYWDWKGAYGASATTDNQKLSGWVEDLEKSCKAIFGEQCKVKELADKQVGTWTEIFREPKVKATAAVAQSQ